MLRDFRTLCWLTDLRSGSLTLSTVREGIFCHMYLEVPEGAWPISIVGQKVHNHLRLDQNKQATLESNIRRESFWSEVDKLQAFQASAAFKQY